MTDHEQQLMYALRGMKIKRIIWKDAYTCYLITEHGNEIDVFFETPENQIEISSNDTSRS